MFIKGGGGTLSLAMFIKGGGGYLEFSYVY